ncbi:patatin-like phospholipase family protein [Nocardia carnea]|uniref:patatin-like phospholipase family protein n=1 Tax=Nocardia carnea TaxID=37328 RepID=UPI0024579C7F|nr:patatin-like phospholipase family protein [Nocardia carnea]
MTGHAPAQPSGGRIEKYWNPDHPVLEILRRRRDSGSTPGNRRDSAKVALTVAGGGMRGAISAAMCAQLEDAGFRDAFDIVYGCSAGAINAAYFLSQPAGTCWYPLSIYYEDLSRGRLIRYSGPLRGRPALDLDYVFEEILGSKKPLHYSAAVGSQASLVVLTTDLDARETYAARDFASEEELKAFLRAGARPPLAVRGESHIDGRRLVDGALLAPPQFRLALADGCTHVLALGTRRFRRTDTGISNHAAGVTLANRAYARYLERLRDGLGTAYLAAVRHRRGDRERLFRLGFASDGPGPHVLSIAPLPWMNPIRFHDTDPNRIFEGIRDAYAVSHCATEGIGVGNLRDGLVRTVPRVAVAGPGGPRTRQIRHPAGTGGAELLVSQQ